MEEGRRIKPFLAFSLTKSEFGSLLVDAIFNKSKLLTGLCPFLTLFLEIVSQKEWGWMWVKQSFSRKTKARKKTSKNVMG